jgi:hypothetical protein
LIIGEILFFRGNLDDYLRGEVETIDEYVRQHASRGDLDRSDAAIAAGLLPRALVAPLVVDFDNPQKRVSEVRVTVRDFGEDVEINGVRAERSFAFTGDAGLFELRTNPFTTVFPHGIVSGGRVTIGMEGRNDADMLKAEIDRTERLLREYVGRSRVQVDTHNRALEGLLAEAVARRRTTLAGLDDLKNRI